MKKEVCIFVGTADNDGGGIEKCLRAVCQNRLARLTYAKF